MKKTDVEDGENETSSTNESTIRSIPSRFGWFQNQQEIHKNKRIKEEIKKRKAKSCFRYK